jgi:sodium--glutamate symport carrier gltS
VGLAAPLSILRTGGRALVILLGAATTLAVLQNFVGVGLAKAFDAPPLLGVVCGSLTLVGGHGTVLGFASRFEEAGRQRWARRRRRLGWWRAVCWRVRWRSGCCGDEELR